MPSYEVLPRFTADLDRRSPPNAAASVRPWLPSSTACAPEASASAPVFAKRAGSRHMAGV
ncbi:hypothetical protein [Streptomyces pseudogriseolus]|uniref:hypothetical protein n=1 Tax=Streptomyces pseudogriseolus TaxID=36817 RepID=UPI003FA31654